MYVDKLDGIVDAAFYDRMSAPWREEQNHCKPEIDRLQTANQSYMDEGVQILELASNAQALFESQEPRQKRRLLNFLLSNCSWQDGGIVSTFRQPFDLLAETTRLSVAQTATTTALSDRKDIWLPFLRTYRTMCLVPGAEFRLLLEEAHEIRFAA